MPKYRVQLKQGQRTIVEHIEAKSVADLLAFFKEITTMQVTEVLKIEYEDHTMPPIDDFNYYQIFKGYMHTSNRQSKQIILHNIKPSKTEKDIAMACKLHLEVNTVNVDSLISALFKRK